MSLPSINLLRKNLNLADFGGEETLDFVIQNSYRLETSKNRSKINSMIFPIIVKKTDSQLDLVHLSFELLDFFSECKIRNCSSIILFILYSSPSESIKRNYNEIIDLTYRIIKHNLHYSIHYKYIDHIKVSLLACDLEKIPRFNISINHFYNASLIHFANEEASSVYLSKNINTTEIIRHNTSFHFVRSSIKFHAKSLLSFLPNGAKLPPEGYCSINTLLRLVHQTQCSLNCINCELEVLKKYPDFLQDIQNLEKLVFSHVPDNLYYPRINSHHSKKASHNKNSVVILYGSPSLGLSNISMLSLCSSKKHQNSVLVVETIFPALFYTNYQIEEIKVLYKKVGNYFGFNEIIFTSDNPDRFISGIENLQCNLTLKDLLNSLPFAKVNKINTELTINDIFHFSSMAFLLKEYKTHHFYIQARNAALFNNIFKAQSNISYTNCHDFQDYGLRFYYDNKIEFFLETVLTKTNANPTSFQKQLDICGLLKKEEDKKLHLTDLDNVNIVTTHIVASSGGGVGISILNTIEELNKNGIETNYVYNSNLYEVKSINERIKLQENTNNIIQYTNGIYLCYDFDGFNIPKSNIYKKVVFIRTDFFEWFKYETDSDLKKNLELASKKLYENINNCDAIICNSHHTLLKVKKYIKNIDTTPAHFIHNGLNKYLTPYLNKQYELKDENTVLAYGFFYERKNFDILLRASDYLLTSKIKHKIILLGKGPQHEKLIKLSKNNSSIFFEPYKEDFKQLAYYLNSATVIVNPAMQEDFGNPYIEAGAAYRPILAPDIPIARELIKNGFNGLLYEPNNPHMLATLIEVIFKNKKLHRKLSINGYNLSKKYTWEDHVNQLTRILSQVV